MSAMPTMPTMPTTRLVEVRTKILKKNDEHARALRARFEEAGVRVVSWVSSPGSGKTELLKQLLLHLKEHRPDLRIATLVGDLATDNDADRLAAAGYPVAQILTGTMCHLEADMTAKAMEEAGWALGELDVLLVENVGNLVCPATYDLGEALRVVAISTTEGEDKPLKYPTIFNTADVAVITKMDLAEVLDFDEATCRANIDAVRPGMPILGVSARTGAGLSELAARVLGEAFEG